MIFPRLEHKAPRPIVHHVMPWPPLRLFQILLLSIVTLPFQDLRLLFGQLYQPRALFIYTAYLSSWPYVHVVVKPWFGFHYHSLVASPNHSGHWDSSCQPWRSHRLILEESGTGTRWVTTKMSLWHDEDEGLEHQTNVNLFMVSNSKKFLRMISCGSWYHPKILLRDNRFSFIMSRSTLA